MKKHKPVKLSSSLLDVALKELLGESLYPQYIEYSIHKTILPKILGDFVCSYLENISIKESVMYIKLKSAALRSNLTQQKSSIMEKINEEIGSEFVKNIVFL